jgi:hypothetical protein
MSQTDLNRAVARATGESVQQIRKLGFQLVPVSRRSRRRRRRQPAASRVEAAPSWSAPRSR